MSVQLPETEVAHLPPELPGEVAVLDVREPDEWAAGHIEGALHIPMQEVPGRLADVPVDGQVLVVCKVGGRSAQAVAYLSHLGRDAVNLDGGMVDWAAAGRPMVSDLGQPPRVV